MLFRKAQWEGLADGSITAAFRFQKRPTVKAGGTLQSAGGLLSIDSVTAIEPSAITNAAARRAGYRSADAARDDLGPAPDGKQLYRVEFHRIGDDPRIALRESDDLDSAEMAALQARLDRLDRAAPTPWTTRVLRVLADNPGVVSTHLAPLVDLEREAFKLNVRKLKSSGLTESLTVGYRISPRGEAVLRARES